jgi:hypothetical protein
VFLDKSRIAGISSFVRIQGGKRDIGNAVIEKPKNTQSERNIKILLLTINSHKTTYTKFRVKALFLVKCEEKDFFQDVAVNK